MPPVLMVPGQLCFAAMGLLHLPIAPGAAGVVSQRVERRPRAELRQIGVRLPEVPQPSEASHRPALFLPVGRRAAPVQERGSSFDLKMILAPCRISRCASG